MYAIIESGGKQYRVVEGDVLRLEKVNAGEGDTVFFDRVLAIKGENGLQVGNPYLEGIRVSGTVLRQGKGKKITVFKYKPKKNYRRKQGHRQPYSQVKIESIQGVD